jgi:hypothetical protein
MNDQRSSTSQNKLNDEAMIYFNPDLTKSLILDEVIDEFVDIKVRKMITEKKYKISKFLIKIFFFTFHLVEG